MTKFHLTSPHYALLSTFFRISFYARKGTPKADGSTETESEPGYLNTCVRSCLCVCKNIFSSLDSLRYLHIGFCTRRLSCLGKMGAKKNSTEGLSCQCGQTHGWWAWSGNCIGLREGARIFCGSGRRATLGNIR